MTRQTSRSGRWPCRRSRRSSPGRRGEGWNPGLHDARAFFAADPGGFLGAFVDGELAGAVSAVRYGAGLGFIGLFIVQPEYRRHLLGVRLGRAALEPARRPLHRHRRGAGPAAPVRAPRRLSHGVAQRAPPRRDRARGRSSRRGGSGRGGIGRGRPGGRPCERPRKRPRRRPRERSRSGRRAGQLRGRRQRSAPRALAPRSSPPRPCPSRLWPPTTRPTSAPAATRSFGPGSPSRTTRRWCGPSGAARARSPRSAASASSAAAAQGPQDRAALRRRPRRSPEALFLRLTSGSRRRDPRHPGGQSGRRRLAKRYA